MKDIYQKGLVSRALEVYRTEGSKVAVEKAGARLRNMLLRRNRAVWFGRELISSLPASKAQVAGSFSTIAPQQLMLWMREKRSLAWAADTRELGIACECGHCWTCWRVGGEIAAFCKVGGRRVFVVDLERVVSLPEGLAFMSDLYVLPEMRRSGIARQLIIATTEFLRENSFSVVGCHIPAGNEPSINLFSSLGFRPVGEIRFTRVLGVSIFSTKPEALLKRISTQELRDRVGTDSRAKPGRL